MPLSRRSLCPHPAITLSTLSLCQMHRGVEARVCVVCGCDMFAHERSIAWQGHNSGE